MPEITRDQLRSKLKQNEFAPVYVLYGAERFLRDAAARYIGDKVFGPEELREFNETEFSLNTPDNIENAISAAEQLPMLANRRVIRIIDVRVGATAAKDSLKESFEDLITGYLNSPAETSIVIFIADELNGNRKISKLLKQKALAVNFEPLTGRELNGWVQSKIENLGGIADNSVISYLLDIVGNDLQKLSNEIGKLTTAAIPDMKITRELIDQLTPNSREIASYGLTDNLVTGQGTEALKLLRKIVEDGAEPVALVGLIASTYRRLLLAKEMMAQGSSRSEVISTAKIFGSGQESFLSAARRLSKSDLKGALKRIADTDLALKTSLGGGGPTGQALQLEMLVCELAVINDK